MLAGDYKRRTQSATTAASVSSGFLNTPVHVPPGENAFEVAQAGSVLRVLSINVAPSSGTVNLWFQDAAGTIQTIVNGAAIARDYKQEFYCPWPVYISTPGQGEDVTVFVHAPAKGNSQD